MKEYEVNEPQVAYGNLHQAKAIVFFESPQQMEEQRYKMLASLTYEERLTNLECQRKLIYSDALLPDGSWPPLSRKLTVIKLPYEVCR